jgi:hypothetical protein
LQLQNPPSLNPEFRVFVSEREREFRVFVCEGINERTITLEFFGFGFIILGIIDFGD